MREDARKKLSEKKYIDTETGKIYTHEEVLEIYKNPDKRDKVHLKILTSQEFNAEMKRFGITPVMTAAKPSEPVNNESKKSEPNKVDDEYTASLNKIMGLLKQNQEELSKMKISTPKKTESKEMPDPNKKSLKGAKIKAAFKKKSVKITAIVSATVIIITAGGVLLAKNNKKEDNDNTQETISQYEYINTLGSPLYIVENCKHETGNDIFWLDNTKLAEDIRSYGPEMLKYVFSIVYATDDFYFNANNNVHNLDRLCANLGVSFEEICDGMTEEEFYQFGIGNRTKEQALLNQMNYQYDEDNNEVTIRRNN